MLQRDAFGLVKDYGFAFPRTIFFKNLEHAEELNYPVVLKVDSEEILHKSDEGFVKAGLMSYEEVEAAVNEMQGELSDKGVAEYDFMLQESVHGVELIIGAKKDPTFGHVIILGLGGTMVELLGGSAMRIAPLERKDCEEMLEEFKGSRVLDGFRNLPSVNRERLIEALLYTSRLVVEQEVDELDFNPVICNESNAFVVDARVMKDA